MNTYIPNVHEILYWVDKSDPYGAVPTNPADDPQFNHWEYPVQQWLKTQYIPNPIPPTTYDDVHTAGNSPHIIINTPNSKAVYSRDQKIIIQIGGQIIYPLSKLDFYINDTYIGSSNVSPFLFSFTPGEIKSINSGKNTLKIVTTDSVYNKSETSVDFNMSE